MAVHGESTLLFTAFYAYFVKFRQSINSKSHILLSPHSKTCTDPPISAVEHRTKKRSQNAYSFTSYILSCCGTFTLLEMEYIILKMCYSIIPFLTSLTKLRLCSWSARSRLDCPPKYPQRDIWCYEAIDIMSGDVWYHFRNAPSFHLWSNFLGKLLSQRMWNSNVATIVRFWKSIHYFRNAPWFSEVGSWWKLNAHEMYALTNLLRRSKGKNFERIL